jgi:hypothetical protein
MTLAQRNNGSPIELTGGDVRSGDLTVSYAAVLSMSEQARKVFDVETIVELPIPEGKIATSSSLAVVNGQIVREWVLVDAPPPPVPYTISDRQFAQVLALQGLITEADALAWVKVGTVPEQLQALVDDIDDDQVRFAANMLLGGATEFNRDHPMVAQLGAGLQMTSSQIDDIWRVGAQL